MRNRNRAARGYILMITLLLVSVMGILAVSYLLVSSSDYRIAVREEWGIRAFYLARSGLEYYSVNSSAFSPGDRKRLEIEGDTGRQLFEIKVTENDVISTGIIASDSGSEVLRRALKAPQGDIRRWYEVSP